MFDSFSPAAFALRSFEIARLSLRVALTALYLASVRLLMALVRAALFVARLICPPGTTPPPANDPCTPGK
ncbi:MAG: hypothetical protein F4Z65_03735 [Acidobacteria bacterium]|nr:hypothetical protein [Acidobacteriota bacterium]MYA47030.1 hypothetical protein [Acidobacteriota bacterium]